MKKQELIENLKDLRDSYPNNDRHDGVRQGLLIAIGAIQNLEEPKKVVIPKFVADWIEEMKQDKRPFYSVMSTLMNKTNHEWAIWKSANMNFSEIVAQAWLEGYEVEKEQLYYVLNKQGKTLLMLMSGEVCTSGGYALSESTFTKDIYQLTEKQIKDYDERYWQFAVEESDDI